LQAPSDAPLNAIVIDTLTRNPSPKAARLYYSRQETYDLDFDQLPRRHPSLQVSRHLHSAAEGLNSVCGSTVPQVGAKSVAHLLSEFIEGEIS
jgi:hypothetical protein